MIKLIQSSSSILLLLWLSSITSSEDHEKVIANCCQSGIDYADRWPSIGCTINNQSVLSKVNFSRDSLPSCEIIFRLCCTSRHQSVNCDLGKSLASSSSDPCLSTISYTRYAEQSNSVYDCCQSCKLGITAREEGRSCSLKLPPSQFNSNWIKSFTDCCSESSPSSLKSITSSSSSSSSSHDDNSHERETDSTESKVICENGFIESNERCNCKSGYKLNQLGLNCIDINECLEYSRACEPWEDCTNQIGSYNCSKKPIDQLIRSNQFSPYPSRSFCPTGLTRGASGSCIDIDECVHEPPVCHPTLETCVNVLGSYRCEKRSPPTDPNSCPNGYRSINSRCIDIDECSIGMHRCRPSVEDCVNLPGSYECRSRFERLREIKPSDDGQCDSGYTRTRETGNCEDIDECYDANRCPDTHRCINMPGNFLCIRKNECGTGYVYNVSSDNCDDIDECESSPKICGSSMMFKCVNNPGTYKCVRIACPPGQNLLPEGICQSIKCPVGYEKNSQGKCEDVDECTIPERCPVGHSCINLIGTYQCRSICESGLRYDSQRVTCVDIDECAEGSHNCLSGQTCTNGYRSFSCSCPPGQKLDEYRRCIDIDECAKYGPEVCPVNSICVNKEGSFDCICQKGYRQSQYSQGCDDIDECQETPWVCPDKCINTQGSYICSCSPGYRLADDGKTCVDIDECSSNMSNLALFCEGNCTNTAGSYICSCSEGFQVRDNQFCDDINECLISKPCGESICLNTIGSYKCFNQDCPQGYIRDTAHTHRCKKPRNSVQCVGDKCYEIYKRPLSYSYSYISIPSGAPIPPTGRLALFTARGPLIPGSEVIFKLNVTNVQADNSVEPATRDDFHLTSVSNEATISLVKSLKGEQLTKLELDLDLYQGDLPSGTTKIILMLHIAKHPLRQSRRQLTNDPRA